MRSSRVTTPFERKCQSHTFAIFTINRYYNGYKATTAGTKHQEALNHLEKKLKKNPELNTEDTLEVINCASGHLIHPIFNSF